MTPQLFQLKPVLHPGTADRPFYVLDCFPYLQFVTDEDGAPKSFESLADALEEAGDCQNANVVTFE